MRVRYRLERRLRRLLGQSELLGAIVGDLRLKTPIIYGGDEDRVVLGHRVILNDALLNVSSGDIYIGDDTFFGHGVSLLTGTHDKSERGRARKRSVPVAGRDIIVGKGVWIATNATVVGPCHIGDHAVVAAGALVIENVASETMVGGVPAKTIGRV